MQWPMSDAGRVITGGSVSASSTPAVLTASGTTHTKGSWVELVTSTGYDTNLLWLGSRESTNSNGVDNSLLIDVGVGGSGSEVALISNLMWGHHPGERSLLIPIGIPSGTRISARFQSAVASKTMDFNCLLAGGGGWAGPDCGRRATTYGANTATSSGINSATPGSANTKSAWTQITSSTTNPIKWLIPMAAGPNGVTAFSNLDALIDIGIGGAGSEQVIVADLPYRHTTAEYSRFVQIAVPVNIAAGTRLAVRHAASITTQVPSLAIIGVD